MIKLKSIFLSSLIFALLPLSVFAAEQCLSGKPGNNHLITQLKNVKASPITGALYKKYNLDPNLKSESPKTGCTTCSLYRGSGTDQKAMQDFFKVKQSLSTEVGLLLNAECLQAAGKTDTATSELKCPDGTSNSNHNFCFTEDMSRYQNAAITDFYKCIKKLTNFPLTPRGLFEMYSLESGFKPHFAYSGGVGMGQLTGIYVADINQKNRGFRVLEKVANSADNDCSIAKKIATKDVKNPLTLSKNRCEFVEYGKGMERNVLYTMIGMANSWDKDIEPLMEAYQQKYKNNPDLKRALELALLNSYGPGGRAGARAAVRRLTKLNPKDFVAQISKPMPGKKGRNLTQYVTKMLKRQSEIAKVMSPDQRLAHSKQGAQSCVNK